MRARVLAWDGCQNVRDLGGLPTDGGGVTSYRRLVRADSVAQLSDDGVASLVEYGVSSVVDIRMTSELERDWPRTGDVSSVHAPFCRDISPGDWAGLDELLLAADNEIEATRSVYLDMLEQNRRPVAAAVSAVAAAAADGTVLVHCQGGKDRTGLLSALVLDLAGVDRDAIAADYAHSRVALSVYLDAWIDGAPDETERKVRALVSATPVPSMLAVLGDLDERYGSPREYLLDSGVDAHTLTFLRELLRP